MRTSLCDQLGIEFPIFAFTHCRDVVAAVSKAGGFGVLGAVGFSAEQLEIELNWIDENIGDKPYGVDIVIPGKYEGIGEMDTDEARRSRCARWCRRGTRLRRRRSSPTTVCPKLPEGESATGQLLGWTAATAAPQVEMRAEAPEGAADRQRARHAAGGRHRRRCTSTGRLVAALCGSAKHARKHKDAGIDIIIAQGYEARRPHRRDRQRRAVARGHRRGGADPGARRRRHRHRPPDRRGAGDGRRRACGPVRCG